MLVLADTVQEPVRSNSLADDKTFKVDSNSVPDNTVISAETEPCQAVETERPQAHDHQKTVETEKTDRNAPQAEMETSITTIEENMEVECTPSTASGTTTMDNNHFTIDVKRSSSVTVEKNQTAAADPTAFKTPASILRHSTRSASRSRSLCVTFSDTKKPLQKTPRMKDTRCSLVLESLSPEEGCVIHIMSVSTATPHFV